MASHLPRLENLDGLSEVYKNNASLFNAAFGYAIAFVSVVFLCREYLPIAIRRKPVFGLPRTVSNISDEFEYSKDQQPGQTFNVKSLWVYPVKGCRGIEVTSSKICHTGLQYDRQLMFASCNPGTEAWSFASQRGFPKMALIHTAIDPTKNTLTISYPAKPHFPTSLIFGNKFRKSFTVPLNVNILPQKELAKYPIKNVEIWKQNSVGYDLSAHIPQELKDVIFSKNYIKPDIALFAVVDGQNRGIKVMGPPEQVLGRVSKIGFADFAPIHIVGLSSVREFNELVKGEVPKLSVLRFRPNVVVSGSPSYDEDNWKTIKIGNGDYHVISRTPRCKVPNNDPDTGERNRNEPDVTIRAKRNVDPGAPLLGCMGMHMVAFGKEGSIGVGDKIDVNERTSEHEWGRNLWEKEYPQSEK
ncbi:hypothetical protein H072_3122 [Dactylellina haptotyla CBS 200.50]|uniref:MOSC domain-containing protein n=1 Tax=Dactylellina haptotyla (strain CBS 200.50) TaxID=1284197 RepID=S8BTU6_DACHA|nr:hypothetical protein H072_3122 [Dactylellina haptotyla CBS 200.50]